VEGVARGNASERCSSQIEALAKLDLDVPPQSERAGGSGAAAELIEAVRKVLKGEPAFETEIVTALAPALFCGHVASVSAAETSGRSSCCMTSPRCAKLEPSAGERIRANVSHEFKNAASTPSQGFTENRFSAGAIDDPQNRIRL